MKSTKKFRLSYVIVGSKDEHKLLLVLQEGNTLEIVDIGSQQPDFRGRDQLGGYSNDRSGRQESGPKLRQQDQQVEGKF